MENQRVFPLDVGGTEKYDQKTLKKAGGDLFIDSKTGQGAMISGPEALAQNLEAILFEIASDNKLTTTSVDYFVEKAVTDLRIRRYFKSIDDVEVHDGVIEIVFLPFGYSERYKKRIAISGPSGAFPDVESC